MVSQSELQQRIRSFDQNLSDADLREILQTLAARRGRDAKKMLAHLTAEWPVAEGEALDVAASLAARHHGLAGDEARIRSWLALFALRRDLVRQLGEEPRHVFEEFEKTVLAQTQFQGESIRTIWRESMLEPKDAAVALGAKKTNREKIRRIRKRSLLLGLPSGRGYLYPMFQFDAERREIFPEVRAVNERLNAASDPWGVASWWVSCHARLGTRPVDLVGTDRAGDLVTVAESVVEQVG